MTKATVARTRGSYYHPHFETNFRQMKVLSKMVISGLLELDGQGGNCPPTFAEISLILLKNRSFFTKFLSFAPSLLGKFQQPCMGSLLSFQQSQPKQQKKLHGKS